MIQSLERAIHILEELDATGLEDGIGVQALSKKVSLKLPTTHNMLKTLASFGYVIQDKANGKYRLGPKALSLGMRSRLKASFAETVKPVAANLCHQTDETVVVAYYANMTWHSLFQMHPADDLGINVSSSFNKNLYISATGRSILSFLSHQELQCYVDGFRLPKEDWDGIDSIGRLKEALEKIKADGYAIYPRSGVMAIAVPLHSRKRPLEAAMGVYYIAGLGMEELRAPLLAKLREAASAFLKIWEA